MPKKSNKTFWGGLGRAGNAEEKHYFGHDDRMGRSNDGPKYMNNKPRVSFKKQTYKSGRMRNLIKPHFDDDVLMSASSNNNSRQVINRGRGKSFIRGRNSPLPHNDMRDSRSRQIPISLSNWYKVIILHGKNYTKEFVLGSLLSYTAPFSFIPIMYQIVGTDAIFYVEDHRIATKIVDCDKRITTSDGFKMQIRVRPGVPPIQISDALKERLKQAMGKRYVQETNALDLSKFYHDPELAGDYWCPLARPNMLMAVLDIVQEHIPNLEALNLDSNKMCHLDKLSSLANKFEKLKILHIGDNKIKEINHLNVLKNLQLEELRLEGNPMCNKYKNRQDDYVSDIRKKFPKLLKLDGIDLPPPIVFDVEEHKLKLPSTQRMFIVQSNAKAQEVASQFLQQYFLVFDSENRQPLLDAYHEHACLSMTVTITQSSSRFSQYFIENRNLYRIIDSNRRRKLLKQGRLPVVSFISEMPRTKHDLTSFTMDLSLVTDRMMLITVTGLFKELHSKDNKEHLRYFNRTFIIVPEGVGFCISNEQLHISNPTMNQEKQFSSIPLIIQPTAGPSTPSTLVNSVPLTEEVKQQMTMTLSQQTNMNIEWSLKCLEEVQWNFENARVAFQEAFSLGKIPPTAFTKQV
ncbi:PREDICTED: nuclear RNA export factor 1 [Ceratosolen solmsi marchali]|uniref:Nuclear RNA export factor 1 n=1 Tax=Ceratosolen solmsi marchali TaxID=326594 RepID=A0AAJ7DZT1_9HYME|nr:PREDICTED: nuclear RNA export factor 1 [Ceratosolen solmsi marchali]